MNSQHANTDCQLPDEQLAEQLAADVITNTLTTQLEIIELQRLKREYERFPGPRDASIIDRMVENGDIVSEPGYDDTAVVTDHTTQMKAELITTLPDELHYLTILDTIETDFTRLSAVERPVHEALHTAGITTFEQLLDAPLEEIHDAVEQYNRIISPSIEFNTGPLSVAEATAFHEAGATSRYRVAQTDAEEYTHLGVTLNRSKIVQMQQSLDTSKPVSVTEQMASQAQAEATVYADDTEALVDEQLSALNKRRDADGHPTATVTPIDDDGTRVGEPLVSSQPSLSAGDPEAHYIPAHEWGTDYPDPTPLLRYDGRDHPRIPRPASAANATRATIPTIDGEPIPPYIPPEPHRDVPIDEFVSRKLARGTDHPIYLVGPHGCGKNLLLKWICFQTNLPYYSMDVGPATTMEDIFGPLTPDDGNSVTPQPAVGRQALADGGLLVINEFSRLQDGVGTELHRLLDSGVTTVPKHGVTIEPHPASRIVITDNPGDDPQYPGASKPGAAKQRRWTQVTMSYPGSEALDEETDVIFQQVNPSTDSVVVPRQTIKSIVRFAHKTRDRRNWPTISTAGVYQVCEDVHDGVTVPNAVQAILAANKRRGHIAVTDETGTTELGAALRADLGGSV